MKKEYSLFGWLILVMKMIIYKMQHIVQNKYRVCLLQSTDEG